MQHSGMTFSAGINILADHHSHEVWIVVCLCVTESALIGRGQMGAFLCTILSVIIEFHIVNSILWIESVLCIRTSKKNNAKKPFVVVKF